MVALAKGQREKWARETARSVQRQALAALRQKIRDAKARKREAMRKTRAQCRAGKLRARAREWAARERERIRSEAQAMRVAARTACDHRKRRVRELTTCQIAGAEKALAEDRPSRARVARAAELAEVPF